MWSIFRIIKTNYKKSFNFKERQSRFDYWIFVLFIILITYVVTELSNNKIINELPIHMRAKEGISYLPQARSIFRGLTVEENIRAVAEVAIKDEEKQDELVEHLLNEFKIAHLRTASALSLSGGEARRVEIARCLTTSPKVLLLDEPFAALDPIAIIELKEMLRHLKDKGISIFITDHNVKETLDIVDRAYIINNGELIAEGSPQEIVENKKAKQLYLGSQFRI